RPAEVFKCAYAAATPDDDVILALFDTDHPEKFGMVRMDAASRVSAIVDKPAATDLTRMWGCIIWRPRFTEYLHDCVNEQGLSDFALIMNNAIAAGMYFRGYHVSPGSYTDLGTYEEIMEFDRRHREE